MNPFRSSNSIARLAPKTPWYRLWWAWFRGVPNKLSLRSLKHQGFAMRFIALDSNILVKKKISPPPIKPPFPPPVSISE